MTIKEASVKSGYEENELQKLCRKKCIPGAKKQKGKWDIPDDTKFILNDSEINAMLIEILKIRNGGDYYLINRGIFPSDDRTRDFIEYLTKLGYVADCDFELFDIRDVMLRDEGIHQVLDKRKRIIRINIENITLFNATAFSVL